MAYQNYFQPQFQPTYQPYIPQSQQSPQGIIWVQGKAGALGFPLQAGQSAILMDSDAPYVYKKETAMDGRPLPMETYRLVKEEEQREEKPNYVRADQIDDIVTEKIEDIVRDEVERRISELSFKPTRKAKNTEE